MILPKDKIYAKKLRLLRIQKDLKQSVVAEMLGLKSQQDYSKLEQGKKHFSEKLIALICEKFDVDKKDFCSEVKEFVDSRQNDLNLTMLSSEFETLKNTLSLKSEILDFQKLANLMLNKLALEKEIELIKIQIDSFMRARYVYFNGKGLIIVEFK